MPKQETESTQLDRETGLRRPYEKPRLARYGHLGDITRASGSGLKPDSGVAPNDKTN